MSRKRVHMKKIAKILNLCAGCRWSYQRIGWPLPDGVDGQQLERLEFGDAQSGCGPQIEFENLSYGLYLPEFNSKRHHP